MARKVVLDEPRPLKMILYGYAGSTKTRTASTAAWDERTAPALILNAGGNPEGIVDYEVRPDIIEMELLEDFNDPYDWIVRGQPESHPLARRFELKPPYKTLIIDHGSQVQRMYFNKVMPTSGGPAIVVAKREWEHYNKVLYSMIRFSQLYFSLDMHVIMVMQEREGDPESGRPIGPYLEGQAQVEVCAAALIIARMMHVSRADPAIRKALIDVGGQSIAIFKQGQSYTAKDQMSGGRLGDYMVDPSIPKILDLIYPT